MHEWRLEAERVLKVRCILGSRMFSRHTKQSRDTVTRDGENCEESQWRGTRPV